MNTRVFRTVTAFAIAAAALAAAPSLARAGDIADVAAEAGSFETLLAAADAAGLVPAVKGGGPLTVFAPTDAAFAELPHGTLDDLLKPENRHTLATILKFHVVAGEVDAGDLTQRRTVTTLAGQRLDVSFRSGELKVDGANVVAADIEASNGVIHVIDEVLMPSTDDIAGVAAAGGFDTLLQAVKAAGLVEALKGDGPLTVFAPTDHAFARLPDGAVRALLKPENRETLTTVLKLHVVAGRVYADTAAGGATVESLAGLPLSTAIEGGRLKVNGVNVVRTDIDATNGVVHVIDRVLLPESTPGHAMQRIEMAIAVGAPAFNRGDKDKCAEVYRETLTSLSEHPAVGEAMRKRMTETVAEGLEHDDAHDRAWAYRHALDRAYTAMARQMSTDLRMSDRPGRH